MSRIKRIVKVQVSLFTSDGVPSMMIYDENREYFYEGAPPKGVFSRMRGRKKAFFWAYVDPARPGDVELLKDWVPYQTW